MSSFASAGHRGSRAPGLLHLHLLPRVPANPAAPVAVNAKLVQTPGRATLSFDLSRAVAAHAFVLADPSRAVVELPEVNFQVATALGTPPQGRPGDLVAAYRVGLFAPGRSRIVIQLREPATVTKLESKSAAPGAPVRLQIELARTDAGSFRQAAQAAAQSEAARSAQSASTAPAIATPNAAARPVIVLDPGHGGIDPGATGVGGAVEKDIVLEFARILAAKLEASGRYSVVMTRTSDVFVPLADRLKIARAAHAALMVSVHCDTLSSGPEVAGTTVYTVSDRASDAAAARLAESENQADLIGGIDTKGRDANDVADILFDFTRRETRTYAHVFARTLVNYLKGSTRLNYNPQRSAGFWVLKAPDVPSVLIELGYLSSQTDVALLTSAPWRDRTAAAVVAAIDDVFVTHPRANDRTATVSPMPQASGLDPGALRGSIPGVPGAPH